MYSLHVRLKYDSESAADTGEVDAITKGEVCVVCLTVVRQRRMRQADTGFLQTQEQPELWTMRSAGKIPGPKFIVAMQQYRGTGSIPKMIVL